MFPVRRAALRFLSTPAVSFPPRTRTITSLITASPRLRTQTSSLVFQRRWASDESKKDDAPISQIQATPQEEVQNAILGDNAARTEDSATQTQSPSTQQSLDDAPAIAETANATEATEDLVSEDAATGAADNAPVELNTPPSKPNSRASGTSVRSFEENRSTPKPTIYIGNLFFDVTEDDLTKELARFGQIQRVRLIRDSRGLSKGFGYVTFASTSEASKAVSSLNQQLFEGRRLNVAYATQDAPTTFRQPRVEKTLNTPTKTLFIGNMSWEMNDRDLNNLFKGIKNVIDVRVAIDRRTGQPRGFAHADFVDVKSAMEAYKLLEGKETYGRKLRLDYSFGSNSAPRNQAKDEGSL